MQEKFRVFRSDECQRTHRICCKTAVTVSKSMKSSYGIVSVFEKSNDSRQGNWLKDGEEGSETRGGFEGYSQDRAVKKRDEVDACRLSLSLLHFPISVFSKYESMSEINVTRVHYSTPEKKASSRAHVFERIWQSI